jgi:hypothetical protein
LGVWVLGRREKVLGRREKDEEGDEEGEEEKREGERKREKSRMSRVQYLTVEYSALYLWTKSSI